MQSDALQKLTRAASGAATDSATATATTATATADGKSQSNEVEAVAVLSLYRHLTLLQQSVYRYYKQLGVSEIILR